MGGDAGRKPRLPGSPSNDLITVSPQSHLWFLSAGRGTEVGVEARETVCSGHSHLSHVRAESCQQVGESPTPHHHTTLHKTSCT